MESGQLLAAARLMVVFTQSVAQMLNGLGLDKYVELFADEEIHDVALLTSMGPSMVRSRPASPRLPYTAGSLSCLVRLVRVFAAA